MDNSEKAGQRFKELVHIMDTLRGDEGCPWDKEQDEKSILHYFLEEVHEAVDAVASGNVQALAEELGDVLLEIVFLSRIYKEHGAFTISDVLEGINKKLIRRHPHVFGKKSLPSPDKVRNEWSRIKKEEKGKASFFADFPQSYPALLAAFQLGFRASGFGFDWAEPLEALKKVKEEADELEKVILEKRNTKIELEIGDLLFSVVNVSRLLGVNPEMALSRSNRKFVKRIRFIEEKLKEKGKNLVNASLEEMDEIWKQAKNEIV